MWAVILLFYTKMIIRKERERYLYSYTLSDKRNCHYKFIIIIKYQREMSCKGHTLFKNVDQKYSLNTFLIVTISQLLLYQNKKCWKIQMHAIVCVPKHINFYTFVKFMFLSFRGLELKCNGKNNTTIVTTIIIKVHTKNY